MSISPPPDRFHELIELYDAWHEAHARYRAAGGAEKIELGEEVDEAAAKFRELARDLGSADE